MYVVVELQCRSTWTESVAVEGSCSQKYAMGVWYVVMWYFDYLLEIVFFYLHTDFIVMDTQTHTCIHSF